MLNLHRAERADVLAAMLGDLLEAPLADPMTPEIVSVPTRGVERWLTQQLGCRLGARAGRGDGICANVEFPFPGTLVATVLAEVSGEDPRASPWTLERLVWPLLEVVEAHLEEPWLSPLAEHLRAEAVGGEARRLSSVRHLADLYDRYAVHRPELLVAWAEHDDGAVGPGERWQAELWRRLRAHVGQPSPPERLAERCAALRRGEGALGVPERLTLFGLTRLPASHLEVLAALSTVRDVHLYLLHPSGALWERLRASAQPARGLARRDDRSAALVDNPLLASWGSDAREMQLVLSALAPGATASHRPVEAAPATLLGRLQADVRDNLAPPGPPLFGAGDERLVLDPADESVQVHACHGRARQVEVARDAVLHLLARRPDLEPRDIILLCPDVEAFAPLVDAAFAPGADTGSRAAPALPRVPVRIADRSLRQANPLLEVAALLLELAAARVSASQVLDLAGRAPVRRRFGLGDEDLRRLEGWVAAAGIRWGLDAAHRRPFKLDAIAANTWRAGLDRIALGAAMAEEPGRRFGGVLPLDDVSSGDLALLGRLVELLERLEDALDALEGAKPVGEWAAALAGAVDALCATGDEEAWQRAQLGRILAELTEQATGARGPSATALSHADAVELLTGRLEGRPTRAHFRTGEVTLCTLVPMRAVPHRVVCVLGVDDGAFPRPVARDGDDLLLDDPLVGERDPRSEDRQLLLDALLAATEHLVVTYTGRDERTNLERPPAVPIGELLEAIDQTARGADGRPARDHVVVRHPLQPFDARNFVPGALLPGRPWSFDPTSHEGALALQGARAERPAFLPGPLPAVAAGAIELGELEAFLRHPTRAFLRRRLGVVPGEVAEEIEDALPVELGGLRRWEIGGRLLAARLRGADLDEEVAAEHARGWLPPGALATPVLEAIRTTVEAIAAAAGPAAVPVAERVDVELPSGERLVGTVGDVHGDEVRRVGYARLAGSHRLSAWLGLLALSATAPERPLRARAVGRARSGAPEDAQVSVARLSPLGEDADDRRARALAQLDVLVDLYRRGLREPLPLYPLTSLAWADAARRGAEPGRATRRAWQSEYARDGEDRDARHVLVLGGVAGFERLLLERAREDEDGAGWAPGETCRLGRYARRLWDGLLAHEQVRDQ